MIVIFLAYKKKNIYIYIYIYIFKEKDNKFFMSSKQGNFSVLCLNLIGN